MVLSKTKFLVAFLAFNLLFNTGLAFGFYKCTDKNGMIVFTNTGCATDDDKKLEPLPYREPDILTDEDIEYLLEDNQEDIPQVESRSQRRRVEEQRDSETEVVPASDHDQHAEAEMDSNQQVYSIKKEVVRSEKKKKEIKKKTEGINSKYFGTLYQGMSLYEDLANLDTDYDKLDDIIDECKKRIAGEKASSLDDAAKIMRIIGEVINRRNYDFYNYVLRDKNCRYSLIYTAVGEALDLPIFAVNSPSHVFVRYQLENGSYYNWEHQHMRSYNDELYITGDYSIYITGSYSPKVYHISQIELDKGVYLRNLSKQEVLGMCYNMLGLHYFELKDLTQAVAELTEAIRLYRSSPLLYYNRGLVYLSANYLDEALSDFNSALNLAPRFEGAYLARGKIWVCKLKPERAVEDFETVLRINPENAEARKLRDWAKDLIGKRYLVKGVHAKAR